MTRIFSRIFGPIESTFGWPRRSCPTSGGPVVYTFLPSYQSIAMPWRRTLGVGLRLLGRALLYLLILFLCFLWSLACFVIVMTLFCIFGCLKNCIDRREGGTHDLPLLCKGMSVAMEYSTDGCTWLWEFTKTSDSKCLSSTLHTTSGFSSCFYLFCNPQVTTLRKNLEMAMQFNRRAAYLNP